MDVRSVVACPVVSARAYLLLLFLAGPLMAGPPPSWQSLSPGLELGRFGDPPVVVVRVDPARYEFRLLSAKTLGQKTAPTAAEWVERHAVTGAINASMFQGDHLTSVGYMRDGKRVNNPSWSKDKAVFVSQPLAPGLPPVRILDRSCEDAAGIARKYRVAVQNIRMIDCKRRNVWAQQPRKWSTACVGVDAQGRVLLIHVRAPYTTHDLVDLLLRLPLGLERLMYVEGGPEASLYVKVGGQVVVSEMGSFETGFFETDANRAFWPLPNVIAFAAK
jgi:phosphodiester glycosidase